MQLRHQPIGGNHEADFEKQAPEPQPQAPHRDQRGGDQRRPALPGDASGAEADRRPAAAGGQVSENGVVIAPEGTAAELAETFAASSPESSRSRTLVWQDPVATASI